MMMTSSDGILGLEQPQQMEAVAVREDQVHDTQGELPGLHPEHGADGVPGRLRRHSPRVRGSDEGSRRSPIRRRPPGCATSRGSPDQHGNYEPSIARFFGVSPLTRSGRARLVRPPVPIDRKLLYLSARLAYRLRLRQATASMRQRLGPLLSRLSLSSRLGPRLDRPGGRRAICGSCNSASLCRAVVRSRRRRSSSSWPRRSTPSATPRSSSPTTW